MNDSISRQAAINIERNATVDTNPDHFEAHQKFMQFLNDAEISSFGRWQWSNGFNTALVAVSVDLRRLPSAQPERKTGRWIETEGLDEEIRCLMCTNHMRSGRGCDGACQYDEHVYKEIMSALERRMMEAEYD